MFERIVVGVVKIERGRSIAHSAFELAAPFGAEVYLVLHPEAEGNLTEAEALRHGEAWLDSLGAETSVKTHSHVLSGDPVDGILEVAEAVDADLIIVGNKGMKGKGRVLGSVPNSIAHKAPCSVLILQTT